MRLVGVEAASGGGTRRLLVVRNVESFMARLFRYLLNSDWI